MTTPETPEPDFYETRPEVPSVYHAFLYDELKVLFARHQFWAIDRHRAVLGGTLVDFWDAGEHAEVSVVNAISCTDSPETYLMYLKPDGSFVAVHSVEGVARWCIPGAPLLNDEEIHGVMNDLEYTVFDETTSRAQVAQTNNRVSSAWKHAFLRK